MAGSEDGRTPLGEDSAARDIQRGKRKPTLLDMPGSLLSDMLRQERRTHVCHVQRIQRNGCS